MGRESEIRAERIREAKRSAEKHRKKDRTRFLRKKNEKDVASERFEKRRENRDRVRHEDAILREDRRKEILERKKRKEAYRKKKIRETLDRVNVRYEARVQRQK